MSSRCSFGKSITFEDLGGRTRIVWRGDFPTAGERDRVVKEYGADTGLVQTMARLAEYVATQSAIAAQGPYRRSTCQK